MGSAPKRYTLKLNGVRKHFNLQPISIQHKKVILGKASPIFQWPEVFSLEQGLWKCNLSLDFSVIQSLYPHIQLYQRQDLQSNTEIEDIKSHITQYQAQILPLSSESSIASNFDFVNWFRPQDINAQRHIDLVLNVFKSYGLSDVSVNIFACIFFKEYFSLLPESLFVHTKTRPGISALCEVDELNRQDQAKLTNEPKWNTGFNSFTKMEIALKNLMPLPSAEATKEDVLNLIHMDKKSKWAKFGSRSMLLQLFVDNNIGYQELKYFYARFYTLCFCYLRWIPKTDKLKICHMSQGMKWIAIRKLPGHENKSFDTIRNQDINDKSNFYGKYIFNN